MDERFQDYDFRIKGDFGSQYIAHQNDVLLWECLKICKT